MKKAIISIVIIVICAFAVFFCGWTQFRTGADSCGILVSKTSGISKKPIVPGVFSWHWECLLPTNAKIFKYKIEPVVYEKTVSGELPAGNMYKTLLDNSPDFTYSFSFASKAYVKPENIVTLMEKKKITGNENLPVYITGASEKLSQIATSKLLDKTAGDVKFRPESLTTAELLALVHAETLYPEITFTEFSVTASKVPDRELYDTLRKKILAFGEAAKEDKVTAAVVSPEKKQAEERAKALSDLLQKYPELKPVLQ